MKRACALIALLTASALLAAACGNIVNDVTLSFYDDGGGPHGFLCTNANHELLADRIDSAGKLSAVVDLFSLGGSPICSSVAIGEWCHVHECQLLLDRRVCFDLPLTFLHSPPDEPRVERVRAGLAQLKGKLVTTEPPAEVVLLRVVATTASCAEVAESGIAFDCTKLVGCTKSCPVFLLEAGTVQLDLDTPGGVCDVRDAVICASTDLTTTEGACAGAP